MAINMKKHDDEENVAQQKFITKIHDEEPQELSWDDIEDIEDVEQEDTFVAPEETNYPFAMWYHGYNNIMTWNGKPAKDKQGKELMNRGMFFKVEHMPDDFKAIMEKMAEDESVPEEERLAKFVSVKHKSGDVVEYAHFNMGKVRFFPLMTGLGSMGQIANGEVITGPTVTYDLRTQNGNYKFDKNVGVLLVVDALVEAGYVDGQGLPRPILFRQAGDTGREIYNMLNKHNRAVEWARTKGIRFGKKNNELPEPYMIGMQIRTDLDIDHGSGESSRAVKVDAFIPSPREMNEKYILEMYAGVDLHLAMKKMLYQPVLKDGKPRIVLGGPVIKLCARRIQRSRENFNRLNPEGIKLQYGEHPMPSWMAAIVNGEVPSKMAEQKLDPGVMKRQLQILQNFFTSLPDEEAEGPLGIINDAQEELEKEDVEQDVLKIIQAQMAKLASQKKQMESNPNGEEVPF